MSNNSMMALKYSYNRSCRRVKSGVGGF